MNGRCGLHGRSYSAENRNVSRGRVSDGVGALPPGCLWQRPPSEREVHVNVKINVKINIKINVKIIILAFDPGL